jgi:SAM-dependent methyltransferase
VFLKTDKHSPTGERYQVVTCARCGLRYTNPLPTGAELAPLYAEEFYVAGTANGSTRSAFLTLFQEGVFWQRRRMLDRRQPGRVLDIGCGDGAFLQSLKSRGWHVYGTETSAAGCAIARAKGISVHEGELASADFPDGFFDVITLWHVLEHIPDPVVELKRIRRMLKDDGALVVEVPNSDSPTLQFCGGQWYGLDVPRHLQHFSPSTLQALLYSAEFQIDKRQYVHLFDSTMAAYSIADRLRFPFRPTGVRYPIDTPQTLGAAERLLFSILTFSLIMLFIPYPIMTNLLTGNTEIMTVLAKKSSS